MPMHDWENYRRQLFDGVVEIGKHSPHVVRGYQMLGGAGREADLLGEKTRELIAMAVAISLRCNGCIAVHADAARKHGATEVELAEALGVAIGVNAGAALVYSVRAMEAFKTSGAASSS